MASLGDFSTQLIGALGGKPTKSAQKLFSSWQRWEGGMTNNAAMWNPLNLTAPHSGLPTINSVSVVSMPSEAVGVKRTAALLRSGYPALAQAFRTGQVDFANPELQADLNRWLSGKHTPGMSSYVSKIASAYGANVPPGTTAARAGGGATPAAPPIPSAPAVPQTPVFNPLAYARKVLGQYAATGSADLTQLPGAVESSFQLPPPPPPAAPGASTLKEQVQAPGTAPLPLQHAGKEIILPTAWKATHPTAGLSDQGFTHAEDIMGSPGTPVGAPEEGVVEYFHPTGAQGGGSMMIRTPSGRYYWLGHIADGVPAGTKVSRGQVIATISGDHPRPHVHIDWSTSYKG